MHNKFLFIVCHIIGMVAMTAQNNFELRLSRGILFVDRFGQSSQQIIGLNGNASLTEALVFKQFYTFKQFDVILGSGISAINYYYFSFGSQPRSWAFYLPLKVGAEIPLYKQKLISSIMLSNYLSLNPKSTRYEYSTNQRPWPLLTERRVFTNVDLGLSAQIGKRSSLNISTPISVLPIVASPKGVTHTNLSTPGATPYRVRAEMWGVILGIKWKLGKVEEKPKRSKEKVRFSP